MRLRYNGRAWYDYFETILEKVGEPLLDEQPTIQKKMVHSDEDISY